LAGSGFVTGSETSLSQWREIGQKYVLADQKLLQLDQSKSGGIPQQLELRDKLRADLDQVPPPTNDELASLLDSPDPLDRKTALVAAFVKHITSPSITKIIVNRYNDESDFLIRFYSQQALMNLSDDQVRSVQADILHMIRNEKYESHLITSLPTLLRLERDAVIPVLVKYFKEGTSGLKKATPPGPRRPWLRQSPPEHWGSSREH
jgi:hypothetical protein